MDFCTIMNAFSENIIYHNIPMKPLSRKEEVERYLKSAWRFCECHWEIQNIAVNENVVLTERVDNLLVNQCKISLPAMGVFELKESKICVWRDYFDLGMYREQLAAAESI